MTNDKALKNLMHEMNKTPHGIGFAIMRERMLKMAEMTKKHIEQSPEKWENPLISIQCYIDFCNIVEKELSFNNK